MKKRLWLIIAVLVLVCVGFVWFLASDSTETAVSYANHYTGEEWDRSALNAQKLDDEDVKHLPILKFDSPADLEQFRTDFSGKLTMNRGWDEVPSFDAVTEQMDEAYFEKYTVFLVYVPANTSTYRFQTKRIENDGNALCIHVVRTNAPEMVDCAMAGWFITVSIPKEKVAGCTEFDAVLD